MQTIGERIRYLREARGLSQQDLAVLASLQRGNISHYERSKVKPSAEAIVQLAAVLGVTSDWLLTGRQAISAEAGDAGSSGRLADPRQLLGLAEHALGATAAPGPLLDGDLGESERAELLLFSEFLRYRQQKTAAHTSPEQNDSSKMGRKGCSELIREAGSVYLPVFSWAVDASPVLPDAVWAGFVPLDIAHSTNQCFALRVESDDLLSIGIAAGDLLVVSYREQPAPGELALLRVGNETTIGEWHADGRVSVREKHGRAEHAAGEAQIPVLIGRIIRVEKTGDTTHDGR